MCENNKPATGGILEVAFPLVSIFSFHFQFASSFCFRLFHMPSSLTHCKLRKLAPPLNYKKVGEIDKSLRVCMLTPSGLCLDSP